MLLSDLSIKQPVLATMISASLVVVGLFSYKHLSIDLYPDVEIPVLTVQTQYPGASAETVEREVTKKDGTKKYYQVKYPDVYNLLNALNDMLRKIETDKVKRISANSINDTLA